jgi:hypothetical protein
LLVVSQVHWKVCDVLFWGGISTDLAGERKGEGGEWREERN